MTHEKSRTRPLGSTNRLKRMLEISVELNSAAELDALLGVIMDAARELTASEAASVLLLNPHTRELYFAATSAGAHPDLIGMTVSPDSSIAGAVLETAVPLLVSDVRQDPRHNQEIGRAINFETRSLLGVPMLAAGHKVGVLEAINKTGGQFSQDDVETLSTLASLAAIAIHKAGLIAQLREANQRLSELDQLKSQFIAIASHELRTPLGLILGYATLLREKVGGEELEHVLDAAARLRGLMGEMFNLQYIETGKNQLQLSRFCLTDFVREVVEEWSRLADARGHKVHVGMPADRCDVTADPEALRLVMNNLVSNAVKFTPPDGAINISITCRPSEAWVAVQDSGDGIAQADQKHVFSRFFQVENHLTRRHGGLGIGLAVAKDLLELQNGRIWLESEEGQGSIFIFALPLANG